MGMAPLQGLGNLWMQLTWASARQTRSSPGCHMAGFQPWPMLTKQRGGKSEDQDCDAVHDASNVVGVIENCKRVDLRAEGPQWDSLG